MYNQYNLELIDLNFLISSFKKFLLAEKISKGSMRSYLSDVRHFLGWLIFFLESNQLLPQISSTLNHLPSISSLLKYVNEKTLGAYKTYLLNNNIPSKTINRRFSSLRRFGSFCQTQNWSSTNPFDILKNVSPARLLTEDKFHLAEFKAFLWQKGIAKITIKNYLADVKQFVSWADAHALEMGSTQLPEQYRNYLIKRSLSPSSVERKLSSARAYLRFLNEKCEVGSGKLDVEMRSVKSDDDIRQRLANLGIKVRQPKFSFSQLLIVRLARTVLSKSKKLRVSFNPRLSLAVFLIIGIVLGIGGYEKFFPKPRPEGKILGSAPVLPPKYLSFQGRLTDSSGTPITTSTHFRFSIYSDPTASGSAKLYEEAKLIKPDADGIFNTLIGSTTTLDQSIFQQNTSLWLGVTVNENAEMRDRQQIATVAYAFNSQYLQGYGVGATNLGANVNEIPIIDGQGRLTIAAAGPTLQTTSGTFKLESPTLALMTAGTSGNVGIGTSSPGAKLTIGGGLAIGTSSPSSAYLSALAPHGGMIVEGNVGIGTTNATEKLNVNGNISVGSSGLFGQTIRLSGLTASRPLKLNSAYDVTSGQIDLTSANDITGILGLANGGTNKNITANNGAVVYSDADSLELTGVGSSGQVLMSNGAASPSWATISTSGSISGTGILNYLTKWSGSSSITNSLIFDDGTNVGIGTSSPTSLFSVGSSSQFQVDSSGDIVKIKNLTYSWPTSHTTNGYLKNDGSGGLSWTTDITATSMKWNALTNPDGNLSLSMGNNTTTFTWGSSTSSNNLFTLTDTPDNTGTGYLLDIATATNSNLKPFRVTARGTEVLVINEAGNIGIGTTQPTQKLTLHGGGFLQTQSGNPAGLSGVDIGTRTRSSFISGKYAYIGNNSVTGTCSGTDLTGCEFRIYDISNPSNPTPVGGVDIGALVRTIYVSGNYAYLVNEELSGTCSGTDLTGCEFRIYDISNPSNPTPVGGVDIGTSARIINVSGKYAYIVTSYVTGTCSGTDLTGCKFRIYDISNPSNPTPVGGVDINAYHARTVFISGKYAFLGVTTIGGTCSGTDLTGCEFRIYDISNPSNPTPVGGVDTGSNVASIIVSGKYAYLNLDNIAGTCSGTDLTGCEFRIYDISNPSNPTPVGGVDIGGDVNHGFQYISGKYVYIGNNSVAGTCSGTDLTGCEFRIYDISNPSNPTPVGGVDIGGADVDSVFISGKYSYLTTTALSGTCSGTDLTGCEFRIYDISGIDAPSATIGNIAANYLGISENAHIGNNLYVDNALNVGPGGIYSLGPLSLLSTTANNLFALDIQNTSGTSLFNVTNNGNVGIGTTSPTAGYKLDVQGNVNVSGTATIGSNTTIGGGYGSTGLTVTDAGNLSMDGALYVGGTATVAGNVGIGGTLDMKNQPILNIGNSGTDFDGTGGLTLAGDLAVNGSINVASSGLFGQSIRLSGLTNTRPLKLNSNLDVISGLIDLSSTNDITGILGLASGGTNKDITAANGAVVYSDADSLELTGVGSSGQVLMSNGAAAPVWTTISTGGGNITGSGITNYLPKWSGTTSITNSQLLDDGTNVGIGTSTPLSLLQIGNVGSGQTGSFVMIDSNGRVGIGKTTSTYSLDVNGTINAAAIKTPYQHTITVAKSGGDYTTITDALNSITDNDSDNRYLIKVMPGIYNESVTMKDYVDLVGSGIDATVITDSIYAANYSSVESLTISITGAVSWKAGYDAFSLKAASPCYIRNAKVYMYSSSGPIYPLLTRTGSFMYAYNVYVQAYAYPNNGDGLYAITHNAGGGEFWNTTILLRLYEGSGTSDNVGIVSSAWSSQTLLINSNVYVYNYASTNNTPDTLFIARIDNDLTVKNSKIYYYSSNKSVKMAGDIGSGSLQIFDTQASISTGSTSAGAYAAGFDDTIGMKAKNLHLTIQKTGSGGNVYAVKTTSSNTQILDSYFNVSNTGTGATAFGLNITGASPTINNSYFSVTGNSGAAAYGAYIQTPTCNPNLSHNIFSGTTKDVYVGSGCSPILALNRFSTIENYGTPKNTSADISGNLAFSGDASSSGSLVLTGSSPTVDILNGQRLDIQTSVGGDTGLAPVVTILNNGNVGIGTTNPGFKLEVAGTLQALLTHGSGNAVNIDPSTHELLENTSSIRYKKDVTDLKIDTAKIYDLHPVSFAWKESGKEDFGLIAEETGEVLPEMIFKDELGLPVSVKYANLPVLLLAEMKKYVFTESGDLILDKPETTYSGLLDENWESQISKIKDQNYNLKLKTGETINRILAGAEGIFGKIKTGLVDTTNLITINLLAKRVNIEEKIISPVVETEEIQLNPPAGGQTSKLKTTAQNAKLLITDYTDNPAMSIDTESKTVTDFGDLIVEGHVSAQTLDVAGNVGIGPSINNLGDLSNLSLAVSGNASVSGELTTNELVAESARIKKLQAESIEGLEAYLSTPSASPAEQVKTWAIGDPSSDVKVEGNITILGTTSLAQTTISGPFTQDATFVIDEGNSINVLGGTLYLQNQGPGGIDLLAGKVTIDTAGNAVFEGNLTVKGALFAGLIRPPSPTGEIVFDLSNLTGGTSVGFGKVLAKGEKGETVFSLDATGSAQFKGDLAAGSFKVAREAIAAEPDLNGVIIATASAGLAKIPSGNQEVTIQNPYLSEKSLIYLTPTGSTANQVLYLARTKPEEKTFTIGIDTTANKDILFSWWIVN